MRPYLSYLKEHAVEWRRLIGADGQRDLGNNRGQQYFLTEEKSSIGSKNAGIGITKDKQVYYCARRGLNEQIMIDR